MRFLELHLKAFGSFSDRAPIEFPDVSGPGLCVVYGSNEAGKSTALRGIRGLLYGFPTSTPDDFLHKYADIRVGARLRFDDGEELAVMRHKKNKDSLYTYDDREVLHSERLAALVEAIPEALFERFYGLDHPGLREGSAALLHDEGEVGRALFGAGLGVSNLHAVLAGLERDSAALFAPRASKPRLNANISAWNAAQKEIGKDSLDPKVWAHQDESVRAAEARVESLAEEIAESRRELSRLERLKRSLPGLARRGQARLQLGALASVPVLPEDFSERLTQARADRRSAQEARLRLEAKIERETAVRDALVLAPELLAEQERIEALHQRVGGYQEALDQLPRRESKLATLNEEIGSLLQGTTPDWTSERLAVLRSAVAQTASTRALAHEGLKFEERLAKARREAAEAAAELERLQADAAASHPERAPDVDSGFGSGVGSGVDSGLDSGLDPDLDPDLDLDLDFDLAPLRLRLGRCVKLGPIDERIEEERRAYEELDFEVDRRGRALGFAAESLREIDAAFYRSAAFPGFEGIDAMAERFNGLARRKGSLGEEIAKRRSERRDVDEALAKDQSQGVVPKLADLEASRSERDQTWRELRRSAIEADPPAPSVSVRRLADRFEQELAVADGLGDRLRQDAKRVAEQSALEAKATRLDLELAELRDREKALAEEGAALEADWVDAWAATGIGPRGPEEMRGWRRAFDEWLQLVDQRREAARAVERQLSARREATTELSAALSTAMAGTSGRDPFEALRVDEWISHAESFLERWNRALEKRRRRAEERRQAQERAEKSALAERQATSELAEWRSVWTAAVAFLELPEQARPERALERLDEMGRLLERLRERDEIVDRVDKMGRDIKAFEDGVRQLANACAPALLDHPPGPAMQRMQRMLGEALNQQLLFAKCSEALVEAGEDLEDALARGAASEAAIGSLCALAGVEEEAGLDEALRSWRAVEEANAALRQAESELTNLAEGRSIADLESEAIDLDADVLAAQIASLEARIERTTKDEKVAIEQWRTQRDALEAMNGTGRVAELAEAAEATLAEIRRDIDRYVELRMAKQILEDEIARYRQENQAPLLTRSGEIFGALTLGAYPRVESEVNDSGTEFRLVAVDPAGGRIPVAGLSAGTRDQLFLAIRLASFEEAMARGESMPLIADDILIEFDDERSRKCLEVLAQMGRKNQILLFSHHRHIADIAEDLGDLAKLIEL